MISERCTHCNKWKIECDHCRGRGYFNLAPLGSRDCDRCDGRGIKCPDAYRATNCR
jgi:DnaJ-class molecular chaperone